MRCALATVPGRVRGVTEHGTAERAAWIPRLGRPQLPHELVERALAPWIAREPNAPQDFGAREVRILAQPLGDLRRVVRHLRRTADITTSRGALHGRTTGQI